MTTNDIMWENQWPRTCFIHGESLNPTLGPNSQEWDPGTWENKAISESTLPKKSIPCLSNDFKNVTFRIRKSYFSYLLMLYKVSQSNRKVLQKKLYLLIRIWRRELLVPWLNSTSKSQHHQTPPSGVEGPYTGITSSSKKFITTIFQRCSLEN